MWLKIREKTYTNIFKDPSQNIKQRLRNGNRS